MFEKICEELAKEIMDEAKKNYRIEVSKIMMNQARVRINNTLLRIKYRKSGFTTDYDT